MPKSTSNEPEVYIDVRDSQSYPIVKLENTYWLAANLNFKTENSDCFEDEHVNCGEWGRLYPINEIHDVCPDGWRLPNYNDWLVLKRIIDKEGVSALCDGRNWKNNENASNASGLSLVPSGFKHKKKFLHQYLNSSIWFDHSDEDGSNWHFHTDGKNNEQTYYFHTHEGEVYVRKFAVRCVCEEDIIEK
jgi:uncharacterized protein (TIGR02145 family)